MDQISSGVESLGQEITQKAAEKSARLLCELDRWNARINLTAIRDVDSMINGHLIDSLAVRP